MGTGEKQTLKRIAILGSTGSIGRSTLQIVESYPERFAVASMAAGRNVDTAFEQCSRWRPRIMSIADEQLSEELARRLRAAGIHETEVVHGAPGALRAATLPEADFVVSAIVGVAGLEATHAAIAAGKTVGLANKECLVAAGEILVAEARRGKALLLPIDSEHNAIHQCMRAGEKREVRSIWLTASGGPFRTTPIEQLERVTVAQALHHPTWNMGRRITIDSATMLNKGLEIIEACRLFALPPSAIHVTVHPQSTVHSLVEFVDGSLVAQLSVTDMRLPILYALTYPERIDSDLRFDMAALAQLDFSQPDFDRFPCLRLAYAAAEAGGEHPIALNAADEIAVEAFLAERIPFTAIPRTIEAVLERTPSRRPATIAQVLEADNRARMTASEVLAQFQSI
jgi:1-deoxy-D-xylulose-5-phosphate reductoisomerase